MKVAALVLAVPLVLAACGSSSHAQIKVDPAAYVKHAATKTAGLKSEHMVMTAKLNDPGKSISIHGSGDFANSPVKGSFVVTAADNGKSQTLNEVFAGTALYINTPGLGLPGGKKWEKLDFARLDTATALSSISQSPTQFLGQLEAAGSVKSLGAETIGGVETTHYQATGVDLSKIPLVAKLEAQAHVNFGPIDVWIGNSDGYVYRESLSFSATSGGKSASFSFRADFSKFNEAVTVTVPPASETFDMGSQTGTLSTSTTVTVPGAGG